ncbi:hypothetical protein [Nonomuraea sp. NPDC003804]|uniref:hypothetical protein n=1 Tax=Nonomuraea sp. NPDC003804 TaxID=3154547 RepID=UPI0033A32F35
MAIAIHDSRPLVTANGNATTAAFSPPADSLLVAQVMAFSSSAAPAVSGGGLTWTRRVQSTNGSGLYVEIWTAPCAAGATNITVTCTINEPNFPFAALKIDVVTGASLTAPAGNSHTGTSTTNNANVNTYTSSQAGSRGFIAASEGSGVGAPTSTDDEVAWFNGATGFAGLHARKAANTATSGTVVQFNLDASGTAAADWRWAALEIKPGSIDATVSATTVTGAGSIPAPGLHTGATARPSVVTGAGTIPAPDMHAGATARPATVTGAANIPSPNVVAGSAELIEPATVTGSGDVPDPSITAVQNAAASPSVVTGAGDIPSPTVTATFQATITPQPVDGSGVVPSPLVQVPILPGNLVTEDGQVEWNSTVLWGPGTSYKVKEITGWEAMPQADDLSVEEPSRNGAFAGRTLLQRRIVTVKLQVDAISDPTQVSGLLRQLRYDTRTLRDNTLWSFVVRGYTETLLAYGKVIDRTGVMDRDWSVGAPEPVITIMCPDSRRYGLEQHSAVVPANASSATTLVNDGQLDTNPVLRFQGPATNPMLINETLDRILAFDITLGSGDLLVVDTQLGTVRIGSTDHESDLSDTISVPVKEFFLDVGESDISYETDSGGTAGVEILWRDAHE